MLEQIPNLQIKLPPIASEIFKGFEISEFQFLQLNRIVKYFETKEGIYDDSEDSIYILNTSPDIVLLSFLAIISSLILFGLEKLINIKGFMFGDKASKFVMI
jgi:hypothetical protein